MSADFIIEKSTLDFLKKLKENNNKEWFSANKGLYEKARANIEDFAMYLIINISKFDDSAAGLEPKECIFRIYRDIRFSRDKTPYKTNFGIILVNKKSFQTSCGYYLHIEPGNSIAYAGSHEPEKQFLFRMRKKIDMNFDKFMKIINAPDFKKFYKEIDSDTLKKVPPGFNKESPAAEYLKYKEYCAGSGFTDNEVLSDSFADQVIKKFKAAEKFNKFLGQ
jgi:uncharacterized protein (TIGR02453 family)